VATLPDPTTEVQVGFADELAGAAFGLALACEVPFVAEWIGPTPADAAEAAELLNQGEAGVPAASGIQAPAPNTDPRRSSGVPGYAPAPGP
jgi:hypothetical protein